MVVGNNLPTVAEVCGDIGDIAFESSEALGAFEGFVIKAHAHTPLGHEARLARGFGPFDGVHGSTLLRVEGSLVTRCMLAGVSPYCSPRFLPLLPTIVLVKPWLLCSAVGDGGQ